MKFIQIEPNELPDPSHDFQKQFDAYLELCKFTNEERLGIAFFLGATLPGIVSEIASESEDLFNSLKILSLYSKSTGDFSDYGDLNDAHFNSWIYNANLAISKICGDESSIDDNLRTIEKWNVVIGKAEPNIEFLENYDFDTFNLNSIQNLNDELFRETGRHLMEKEYSNTRAYEAGFAYRMMMSNMDVKGTNYLLSRISSYLSPLFEAIFHTPILYVMNNDAFHANHLFSQILNNFIGGENSNLMQIAQPIHLYHQYLFYQEGSSDFREEWLFNKDDERGSAHLIFRSALNIRKTNLIEHAEIIKQSGELYNKSLIDKKIETRDFLKAILEVIQNKYSINGYEEFVKGEGTAWDSTWNHKGDYVQYLVILYYETCIHAMVVEELT
jgi:hypothetical protein